MAAKIRPDRHRDGLGRTKETGKEKPARLHPARDAADGALVMKHACCVLAAYHRMRDDRADDGGPDLSAMGMAGERKIDFVFSDI